MSKVNTRLRQTTALLALLSTSKCGPSKACDSFRNISLCYDVLHLGSPRQRVDFCGYFAEKTGGKVEINFNKFNCLSILLEPWMMAIMITMSKSTKLLLDSVNRIAFGLVLTSTQSYFVNMMKLYIKRFIYSKCLDYFNQLLIQIHEIAEFV